MSNWREDAVRDWCKRTRENGTKDTSTLIVVEYIEATLKDKEKRLACAHDILTNPLYNPKEGDYQ